MASQYAVTVALLELNLKIAKDSQKFAKSVKLCWAQTYKTFQRKIMLCSFLSILIVCSKISTNKSALK